MAAVAVPVSVKSFEMLAGGAMFDHHRAGHAGPPDVEVCRRWCPLGMLKTSTV